MEITLLSVLSVTALVTTICLFFCGIPICLNIRRRNSTKDISALPLLMGALGASFWLRYGFMKQDLTIILVNTVGASLMFCYCIFYLIYSRPKKWFAMQLLTIIAVLCIMLALVQIFGQAAFKYLGFASMTINIINFGAPLAGLRVVIKQRCCETLPFPLCVANFLVSSQWCLYGVLVRDIFLIIPNGIGIILALIQLSLFVIFPWKQKQPESPTAAVAPTTAQSEEQRRLLKGNEDNDTEKKMVNDDVEANGINSASEPLIPATETRITHEPLGERGC